MPLKMSKLLKIQWDSKNMLLFRSFPAMLQLFKFQNLLELISVPGAESKRTFFTFVVFVVVHNRNIRMTVNVFVQVGFTTPNLTGLRIFKPVL